jgi:hypothetical protein
MRFNRGSTRTRRLAVAAATCALVLAAPIAGAGAATTPPSFSGLSGFSSGWLTPAAFPFSLSSVPIAQQGSVGGTVISLPVNGTTGVAGCGSSRPSNIGGTGGVDTQSCFNALSFVGPAIGQVSSQIGPTIIGSTVLGPVIVSGGNVVNTVP